MSIIAIAVMWMGVKAAVSYDEVTKKAFEPFAKFGDSVGNFVQNIPSYLPTPHPAFAAALPSTYQAMGSGISKNVVDTVNTGQQRALADTFGSDATRELSSIDTTTKEGMKKFNEVFSGMDEGNKSSRAIFAEVKQAMGDVKKS